MDQQPAQQSQLDFQPQSLASEGEDFVVITGSNGSSPQTLSSPTRESDQNSTAYNLHLSCPASSSSDSEVQKMAQQISEVSEQQTSLHTSLKDNSFSLEHIRTLMSQRLTAMKKNLSDKEAELGAKNEQCERLQASNGEMKAELAKLRTQTEEWEQTSKDYQSLKNQYNLLTNTKERLESEKADLQRSRDEALAAETQKLQAKFDEERNAAVEKAVETERVQWQQNLIDLQADHVAQVKTLQLELTGAKKENEGNMQAAQAESERALSSERERCRAEADRLLAEHTTAIETMRKEFEDKIQEQVRLTEVVRKELQEFNKKHEAEKSDLLEMVNQFNVSSFSTEQFRSAANDTTMTEFSISSGTCKDIQEVRTLREQAAVQEQGPSSTVSASGPQDVSAAVASMCASVSTSEIGVNTAIGMADSATGSVHQSASEQTVANEEVSVANEQTTVANQQVRQIEVTEAKSQTDPLECPQVENSDSLQRNKATRPLMLQLATFAQALKTERLKCEDLEKSLKGLERENAQLRADASSSGSATSRTQARQDEDASRLRKQLDEKQSELDSLLREFDETRNKVGDLTEKVKYYETRKMKQVVENETASGDSAAHHTEEIDRLRKQLDEKQNELDSLLKDFDETRHTVYELNEKVNEYKCRAEQRAHLASNRAATGGDAGRLGKLLTEKQVELDSVLEDFDETRNKVYELSEKIKEYETRSQRRDHFASGRAAAGGDSAGQQGEDAAKLEKLLADKQVELDSVIKDLDETRNKVCELNEKVKDCENRLKLGSQTKEVENGVANGVCAVQEDNQETKKLRDQLDKKQSELDSLFEDFDETRHKVYELNEKIKDYETRFTHGDAQTQKLKQKIVELESQAEIDKNMVNELQMEIESERNGQLFKADKLRAAENKVEELRQELNRMKTQEEDLRKQCRENDETLRQVIADSDGMQTELKELKLKWEAQRETLEDNKNVFEEKAFLELQLRETITELTDRIERHADEGDKKLMEEKRKYEQLYRKLCEQSELRVKAEQTAKSTNERLRQENQKLVQLQRQQENTQRQLEQANNKLQDSEKFAADLQSYSDGADKELEKVKQQLQESSKKRDDVIQVAEQMRQRLEEELQKSADVETELQKLKLDHMKLRTDYSAMERNSTEMLTREHELKSQLAEAHEKLRQAEEAIGWYKEGLQVKEAQVGDLTAERDRLKERVEMLLENLAGQEQQQYGSGNDFLERHRTMRPPGGGHQ